MMNNLQEITGRESGAIKYSDGTIWIGNWSNIDGLPRGFATGNIGLGEELTAEPCDVPEDIINAMRAHEKEQGDAISTNGFSAWRVNEETIVAIQNKRWLFEKVPDGVIVFLKSLPDTDKKPAWV